MINEHIAYITCGTCGGKFQAIKEYYDEEFDRHYLDSDDEELSRIMQRHWALCSKETPYMNDENRY